MSKKENKTLIRFAKRVPLDIKELYHISFRDDLEGKWVPKRPDGDYDHETDPSLLPETTDARISLSPTIEQCFQAIYANVKHLIRKDKALNFNVYTPVFTGKEWIVYPEVLAKQKFVHDAHVTKEHCVVSPVYMKHIGKVSITTTGDRDKLNYYTYGIKDENDYYGWVPKKVSVKKIKKDDLVTDKFKKKLFSLNTKKEIN